jgi:Type VI secretion system, VipA, VC_A0107 or Hcp2
MPEQVTYGVGATSMPIETNVALGPLPENKSLFVQKLTNEDPAEPEIVKGLETIESVFDRFQPKIEIDFDNEDGSTTGEEISFQKLTDFGPDKMIAKSNFLNELNAQKDEYTNMHAKLKANTSLQKVLSTPEQKAAFISVLNNLIAELNETI